MCIRVGNCCSTVFVAPPQVANRVEVALSWLLLQWNFHGISTIGVGMGTLMEQLLISQC